MGDDPYLDLDDLNEYIDFTEFEEYKFEQEDVPKIRIFEPNEILEGNFNIFSVKNSAGKGKSRYCHTPDIQSPVNREEKIEFDFRPQPQANVSITKEETKPTTPKP